MKKYYSSIVMLVMMVAALGLTACGGDDDEIDNGGSSSVLAGTWDAVSSRYYNDDGWEEIEDETGYWVFTETTVTDHSDNDILNGMTVNYTFNGKELVIGGYIIWEVVRMTSNTMVLKTKIIGAYQETTFRKR